ncbi:MAG: MFS transporter [Myxococcota bacterium]|nr:MFS transporter [Myxococcota bacterium]
MLVYGLPACAVAGPGFLIQSYFLNFATDVLLLAPAAVGILLASVRVWDAVSDPVTGYLTDRTRSRLGRRRPWMFAASPFVAVAFVAVWNPPQALGPFALWVWAALALLAFTTASTAWNIPHAAFGAELSRDPHTRTRIFGLRFMCTITGVAASFGAMHEIVNADDPRAEAGILALFAAAGMALLLWIPPLSLHEARGSPARRTPSPLQSVRAVLGNAQARRLLFVGFAEDMAMGAQGAVAPYMVIYVLQRADMIGVVPAFFIAPMVLSVPLWITLSRRLGKARTWILAQCGGSLAYASLFTLGQGELGTAIAMLSVAGTFSGCGGPLGPALLADVVDRDARDSGIRREGVFFAAWIFVGKASGACVVLGVGLALQAAGFEPNAPLNPASDLAIRACLGIAPAVMFGGGVVALWRYSREAE